VKEELSLVIAFDATSDAFAAEDVFRQNGLSGRLIPLPESISAGCGLAWRAESNLEKELTDALKSIDITSAHIYYLIL
jgi:hypothetical protein